MAVGETYLGGLEEGVRGRKTERKALIVVAAQEDGKGIGRIRMQRVADASAESLVPFVEASVELGSVVHTDGWLGYAPLESKGYGHEITFLRGQKKSPSELLPRVPTRPAGSGCGANHLQVDRGDHSDEPLAKPQLIGVT